MTDKTIGDLAIEHHIASQRWTRMAMMNAIGRTPEQAESDSVNVAEAAKAYYDTLRALETAIGGPFSAVALKKAIRNEFILQDVLAKSLDVPTPNQQ